MFYSIYLMALDDLCEGQEANEKEEYEGFDKECFTGLLYTVTSVAFIDVLKKP